MNYERGSKHAHKQRKKTYGQNRTANSPGRNFLRGIFYGLGWAIGATVIAAAVAAILASVYDSVRNIPFFQ